jgi:hypothetical protein
MLPEGYDTESSPLLSNTDARFELQRSLETALGSEPAATLMSYLPPNGWSDVARQHDITALRTEMQSLKYELMATFRSELMAAITSQTRSIIYANLSLVFAAVGLAFAAVKLSN